LLSVTIGGKRCGTTFARTRTGNLIGAFCVMVFAEVHNNYAAVMCSCEAWLPVVYEVYA
jgi:hypothetical protein